MEADRGHARPVRGCLSLRVYIRIDLVLVTRPQHGGHVERPRARRGVAPSWSAGATTRDQPHTDEPAPFEAAEDSQPLINREAARDVVSASILAVSAARKQAADSVMSRHHSVLFFVQPSRFLVARSGAPIQDHILSRRDCRYLIARHGAPRRKEVPAGAQSGHRAITPRSVSRVSLTRRAAVSPPVFL